MKKCILHSFHRSKLLSPYNPDNKFYVSYLPRIENDLFNAQRTYTSSLAPEVLQQELKLAFQAFEDNDAHAIEDELRPFEANFDQGVWSLHPRDTEKGDERFHISGKLEAHEDQGSKLLFRAEASKSQKWSLFKDSLYGLFLTIFTAFMEIMQDIPLSLVLASIPVMLIFVGIYLQKSQKKILDYRWDQLDKNLGELAYASKT